MQDSLPYRTVDVWARANIVEAHQTFQKVFLNDVLELGTVD